MISAPLLGQLKMPALFSSPLLYKNTIGAQSFGSRVLESAHR